MDCELRYASQKKAGGKERSFGAICSASSGTLQKQKARCDPPGLTVVAYIPHKARPTFRDAINILSDAGHKFQAFEQLHFTILSLFAGNFSQPLESGEMGRLIAVINAFFRDKNIERIQAHFDCLRPGIFVGQQGKGDGTVVAMASEASDEIIVGYAKELAVQLAHTFPHYFPQALKRPLGGVWCSLGFFDEPDFTVDQRVCEAFTRLKRFSATVKVEEVAVTEFTLKSLADGAVRGIVRL